MDQRKRDIKDIRSGALQGISGTVVGWIVAPVLSAVPIVAFVNWLDPRTWHSTDWLVFILGTSIAIVVIAFGATLLAERWGWKRAHQTNAIKIDGPADTSNTPPGGDYKALPPVEIDRRLGAVDLFLEVVRDEMLVLLKGLDNLLDKGRERLSIQQPETFTAYQGDIAKAMKNVTDLESRLLDACRKSEHYPEISQDMRRNFGELRAGLSGYVNSLRLLVEHWNKDGNLVAASDLLNVPKGNIAAETNNLKRWREQSLRRLIAIRNEITR